MFANLTTWRMKSVQEFEPLSDQVVAAMNERGVWPPPGGIKGFAMQPERDVLVMFLIYETAEEAAEAVADLGPVVAEIMEGRAELVDRKSGTLIELDIP